MKILVQVSLTLHSCDIKLINMIYKIKKLDKQGIITHYFKKAFLRHSKYDG